MHGFFKFCRVFHAYYFDKYAPKSLILLGFCSFQQARINRIVSHLLFGFLKFTFLKGFFGMRFLIFLLSMFVYIYTTSCYWYLRFYVYRIYSVKYSREQNTKNIVFPMDNEHGKLKLSL
ncbi:MAG: hypothetical protein FH756_12450 [Firmicutes bacterium]|nr:hypothetical protein [Bacillota bacterium]